MNADIRRGTTLLEAILASMLAAGILVPLLSTIRSGVLQEQRWRVRDAMVERGQGVIDQIRIAAADSSTFASAAQGILPAGVPSTQRVSVLPGERAAISVDVRAADSRLDLVTIEVLCTHESSGNATVAPVHLMTQLARPW